ncbi:hypothetical protein QBC46DRAFT_401019 [Diplogelasinospora grovesii]|uniref:Uncharacterized protein n=1 Tax=Diplogelasinospora grovesii TaxID=303347 RepID=A0AAN6RYK0_9PEZI|nr:hypothetical protein QBC46DRAFT_401019 [Diplogelasinospora grovesii]
MDDAEQSHLVEPGTNMQCTKPMAHAVIRQSKKRDRSGENFKKRWRTLAKTLSELHHDYDAEFHLSMSRKQRNYICESRKGFLPLQASDIDTCYPRAIYITVAKREETNKS